MMNDSWVLKSVTWLHCMRQHVGPREGTEHNEVTERAQIVFLEKVEKLTQAMQDMDNTYQQENH